MRCAGRTDEGDARKSEEHSRAEPAAVVGLAFGDGERRNGEGGAV